MGYQGLVVESIRDMTIRSRSGRSVGADVGTLCRVRMPGGACQFGTRQGRCVGGTDASDGPSSIGYSRVFVWTGLGPMQKAGKTVEAKEVYSRMMKAHD